MKALVISGGGSKGAFAGGVAQYLMEVENREYDILVGTSTGSLLIPQLALNQISKLHSIYTNVNQRSIFSLNPFVVRKRETGICLHKFSKHLSSIYKEQAYFWGKQGFEKNH